VPASRTAASSEYKAFLPPDCRLFFVELSVELFTITFPEARLAASFCIFVPGSQLGSVRVLQQIGGTVTGFLPNSQGISLGACAILMQIMADGLAGRIDLS
jgi:hypothetical protein